MRKSLNINQGWIFRCHDGTESALDLPHTWNALDGLDGGGDYWRGTCTYKKSFSAPEFGADECVYLDFAGVNASAKVILNGQTVMTHDGGYSSFRVNITVYSNQSEVTLYINGKKHQTLTGEKVFRFPITVSGQMMIEARAGSLRDEISIRKVAKPNPDYRLGKDAGNAGDWV